MGYGVAEYPFSAALRTIRQANTLDNSPQDKAIKLCPKPTVSYMQEAAQQVVPERQSRVDSNPRFILITEWNRYFPWPPLGGMRSLRFRCETNGFEKAFKKVGSRVLVDADEFWRVVDERGAR